MTSEEDRPGPDPDLGDGLETPHLGDLRDSAWDALERARIVLLSCAIVLPYEGRQLYRWDLFLDSPNSAIETCAISCAVIGLLSAGEPSHSAVVKGAVEALRTLQLPSGGWTSWVDQLSDVSGTDLEEPLIVDTYFALKALHLAGQGETDGFGRGISWILSAQNLAGGGWGFFPGGESQILASSMALRVLCLSPDPSRPDVRATIDAGIHWMLSTASRAPNVAWAKNDPADPSAVHSAIAILGVAASEVHAQNPITRGGGDWLLDNPANRSWVIDRYVTPGAGRPSRAISHITFPEGVILQAAIGSGADIFDSRLILMVQELLGLQLADGHWRCLHSPLDKPVFAVMDACLGLRSFVDLVGRKEIVLDVTRRVQNNEQVVGEMRDKIAELDLTLRELSRRIERDRGDLVLFRPAMWLTRSVRRYPALTSLVLLNLLAYILVGLTVEAEYRLAAWLAAIVFTIGTGVTLWVSLYQNAADDNSSQGE